MLADVSTKAWHTGFPMWPHEAANPTKAWHKGLLTQPHEAVIPAQAGIHGIGSATRFHYNQDMDKTGYVYIITNQPNGVLYVGVTSNLHRRMHEHRTGTYKGFSARYGLKSLVYVESFADMREAIAREKQIKKWNRAWKVGLILQDNEMWDDLYETMD